MHTKHLTTAAFAALAIAGSAYAADLAPFARIEATLTDSGYEGRFPNGYEPGFALTGGVFLAPQHEVSITTGYTKWDGDVGGVVGVARTSIDVEQIPVLLNYRFHFTPTEKIAVYVGPTAGLIRETATGNVLQNVGPVPGLKPVGSYDDSAWKTAFGGTIGLSYALADGWDLTAAAQVLRLNSKDYDLNGTNGRTPLDSATRVGFTLGASYRW